MLKLILSVALIALGSLSVAAQDIQTLLERSSKSDASKIVAPTSIPYRYLVTINQDTREGDEVITFSGQYRVNPKASAGARVSYIEGRFEDFPEDAQMQILALEKETLDQTVIEDFWCVSGGDLSDIQNDDGLKIVRENETEAVIAIDMSDVEALASGDTEDMSKKMRKSMAGELTLSKPDLNIMRLHFWLTKPIKVKLVLKIKAMKVERNCALAPNGIPYAKENKAHFLAEAFGSVIQDNISVTISDLTPL